MTSPDSGDSRRHQRTLSQYRAAVAVLAGLLIISLVTLHQLIFTEEVVLAAPAARPAAATPAARPARRPPAGDQPVFVDLAARIASLTEADAHRTDYGEHYYRSAAATVHMHVIGHRQSCPLHIHRVSHETTVVVSGMPEVQLIQGAGGAGSRSTARYPPGTVISSPPFCGHQWRNHLDVMQANLVFTAPPFDGNMFLDTGDARLLRGAAPFVLDSDDALRALAVSGGTVTLQELPIMAGKIWLLTFSDMAAVPAVAGPTVLYVTRGHGTLDVRGQHDFGPQHLTTIPARDEIKLSAAAGDPVALLLFRPEA